MDRKLTRLTGRKLTPRRYWGAVLATDCDRDDDSHSQSDGYGEVRMERLCPPSPVAEQPEAGTVPRPTRTRRAEERRASPGEALRQRARHLASLYAFGGAVIGAAPIPNPDMPLLVTVESRLVGDIARLYDPVITKSAVSRAAPLIGLGGYALRALSRRGHRRLPLFGWLVNGVVAYLGVRLTGELAMRWCESHRLPID